MTPRLSLIEAVRSLAEAIIASRSPIQSIACELCGCGDAVLITASLTGEKVAVASYALPCSISEDDFDPQAASQLVLAIIRTIRTGGG